MFLHIFQYYDIKVITKKEFRILKSFERNSFIGWINCYVY